MGLLVFGQGLLGFGLGLLGFALEMMGFEPGLLGLPWDYWYCWDYHGIIGIRGLGLLGFVRLLA
jgi:hypothetical protein